MCRGVPVKNSPGVQWNAHFKYLGISQWEWVESQEMEGFSPGSVIHFGCWSSTLCKLWALRDILLRELLVAAHCGPGEPKGFIQDQLLGLFRCLALVIHKFRPWTQSWLVIAGIFRNPGTMESVPLRVLQACQGMADYSCCHSSRGQATGVPSMVSVAPTLTMLGLLPVPVKGHFTAQLITQRPSGNFWGRATLRQGRKAPLGSWGRRKVVLLFTVSLFRTVITGVNAHYCKWTCCIG